MSYKSGEEEECRWLGFVCPHCPHGEPLCVYRTIRMKLQHVTRVRKCHKCGYVLRTEELPFNAKRRGDLVR